MNGSSFWIPELRHKVTPQNQVRGFWWCFQKVWSCIFLFRKRPIQFPFVFERAPTSHSQIGWTHDIFSLLFVKEGRCVALDTEKMSQFTVNLIRNVHLGTRLDQIGRCWREAGRFPNHKSEQVNIYSNLQQWSCQFHADGSTRPGYGFSASLPPINPLLGLF